eukprot:scpid41478/ scgid19373/ Uncharacterized protein K02A2.6
MDDSGDEKPLKRLDVTGPAHVVAERWRKWKRSFSYYVVGKGITDKTRAKALLLHFGGEGIQDIYDTLESSIDQTAGDALKALTDALDGHFAVTANEPYERHIFRQMAQKEKETVAQFVTRLRNQAKFCNFTDEEDQIRDQLIQAMSDPKLRQKLLEEKNIKLKDALVKARQRELATVQARSMDSSAESSIHQQRSSSSGPHANSSGRHRHSGAGPRGGGTQTQSATRNADSECFSCGRKGHFSRSPECPARGKKCSNCGKVGHFAVVCRSQRKKDKGGQQRRVHDLSADAEQQDKSKQSASEPASNSYSCEMYNVGRVGSSSNKPVFVDLEINGDHLLMELDTGAEHTVIPEKLWQAKWSDVSLCKSDIRLCAFGGTDIPVLGEARVSVKCNAQVVECSLLVVKEGSCALLGRDWLRHIRLDWQAISASLHTVDQQPESAEVFSEFSDVFSDTLGCISEHIAEIRLRDGAVPRCIPARPVPYALRTQLDRELDHLEREGIIKKVEAAEWSSPVVVVRKRNGDIRFCADFKVSINKHIDPQQYPIPNPTDLLSSLGGG